MGFHGGTLLAADCSCRSCNMAGAGAALWAEAAWAEHSILLRSCTVVLWKQQFQLVPGIHNNHCLGASWSYYATSLYLGCCHVAKWDSRVEMYIYFWSSWKFPSHCTELLFPAHTVWWGEAPGIKYSNWVGIRPADNYLIIIFSNQNTCPSYQSQSAGRLSAGRGEQIPSFSLGVNPPVGVKSAPRFAVPTSFQSSITH